MDVLDTSKSRLNRVENDIETLRTTQANILDHLDSYSRTLNETRDIADENRQRLYSIEDRQKQMEDPPADSWKASMVRTIAQMDRIIQIARESNAVLWENRAIALAIAEHLGITIEERVSSVHSG